ncbi:hypothetical protein [Labrenzia sp. OB1]|uniref:hypothetical protein n=1 Tax=Labrenzia sp. OB1 TaxID=1561204 RepID=UPI0018FE81DD|nr:hypothetical protein [Labrenzia sp. OB1]
MSACQTDRDRAAGAGARLGAAAAAETAPPELPPDCRERERSGVQVGDPLDLALIKTDRALGQANARVVRCVGWHDRFRGEMTGGVE